MQVMFTCECGQALRTEVAQEPVGVQCPSCGKPITVWPPARGPQGPAKAPGNAASPLPVGPAPACGKAVAALVLGICGLVPVIGVLATLPAIALGLIVLVRKLPGRGFAIAGLSVAIGSLLTVQLVSAGYMYFVYKVTSTMSSQIAAARASAMSANQSAIVTSAMEAPAAPRLSADEIAEALAIGFDLEEDPGAAAAALEKARRLYDARDVPGNRFECLRQYSLHLARIGRASFADPADAEKHRQVYDELAGEIGARYDTAERLAAAGDWPGAKKRYEAILAEVQLMDNPIHVNALAAVRMCEAMISGDPVVPPEPTGGGASGIE